MKKTIIESNFIYNTFILFFRHYIVKKTEFLTAMAYFFIPQTVKRS